jgi:hypothetical protein
MSSCCDFARRGSEPKESNNNREECRHDDISREMVSTEILGNQLQFAIDPDRLREAGVVWDTAVVKCAAGMTPLVKRCIQRMSKTESGGHVNIIELGAGTGALGIGLGCAIENLNVCVTDLPPVVSLMASNVKIAQANRQVCKNSRVKARALPWSIDPNVPDPKSVFCDDAGDGAENKRVQSKKNSSESTSQKINNNRWHFVAACETLYWGGWTLFDEDTRLPQLCTMKCATANSPDCLLVVAFTVRDKSRETGFVLDDVGSFFWLKRIKLIRSSSGEDDDEDDDQCFTEQNDAETRAYVANAAEGDLLLFQGKRKSQ